MKLVIADTPAEQKAFLAFRKSLYRSRNLYIDNSYYMIKEIFGRKNNFVRSLEIYPVQVKNDNNEILCQAIIAYAHELPDSIQLCFFEALPQQNAAFSLLLNEALRLGKQHHCCKLVAGLCGHVNYGLGFLDSHFDKVNSFSSNGNPAFYNDYFRNATCSEIRLNSYQIEQIDGRLNRYRALLDKLHRNYTFRCFDKKHFERDTAIYTDLNNKCFSSHRYYYARNSVDDAEMLRELFLFMKEDSLIFAYYGEEPVGFIMWYPDFNELAKCGELFGAKHFFKNLLMNRCIRTAKVMEFGVIDAHKKVGLPLALMEQIFLILPRYGCKKVETSWILDENADSNSMCRAVCDAPYKGYVVYEKEI